MILFIENNVHFHYEIIESLLVHYHRLLPISCKESVMIHLSVLDNTSFIHYIQEKYSNVKVSIPNKYDYYISATIFDIDYLTIPKNSLTHFYISHEITERLKELSNVFFLTPLSLTSSIRYKYFIANHLPFTEKKIISKIPIYIIQGNIKHSRRYYKLLKIILDANYEYPFIIKLVGRGYLLEELQEYSDRLVVKNNLEFTDYHSEFLDAYCILPLITKKTHLQYYQYKLTSTINYSIAYGLKCLIDQDLQEIYHLPNVEIFQDETDIVHAFKKTLNDFYNPI